MAQISPLEAELKESRESRDVSGRGEWGAEVGVGGERDSAAAASGGEIATMAAEAGKPRVVVVGGGIAGSLLAKTMQPDADVLLLDP